MRHLSANLWENLLNSHWFYDHDEQFLGQKLYVIDIIAVIWLYSIYISLRISVCSNSCINLFYYIEILAIVSFTYLLEQNIFWNSYFFYVMQCTFQLCRTLTRHGANTYNLHIEPIRDSIHCQHIIMRRENTSVQIYGILSINLNNQMQHCNT